MEYENNLSLWDGWEVVRFIGQGNFGAVYEIRRDLLNKGEPEKAALKVISIPQCSSEIEELQSNGYDDKSITNTFQEHLNSIVEEYTMMRKLGSCANTVCCDDIKFIRHKDGIGWDIFIRMELLTPLGKALPLDVSEEQVIRLGIDICNALVLCRKHKIIHRDIKPQNIMVSEDGTFKLGDFGVAKISEQTAAGTKVGTFKFMAPEVYKSQPYSSSADIYSLGLVMYWLLNKRRTPFLPLPPRVPSATLEDEARRRRLSGEPLPVPCDGSWRLQQIVLKACAFQPRDRYETAEEMLHDLKTALHSPPESRDETLSVVHTRYQGAKSQSDHSAVVRDQDRKADIVSFRSDSERLKEEEEQLRDLRSEWGQDAAASGGVAEESNSLVGGKNLPWLIAAVSIIVAVLAISLSLLREDKKDEVPEPQNLISTQVATLPPETAAPTLPPETQLATEPEVMVTVPSYGAVEAGYLHSVHLFADGTVSATGATAYCKGDNVSDRCDVSGWREIVKISAFNHTVGLKSDGTVVAVGHNNCGQCDVSHWADIIDISAGMYHTLGLRANGTVTAAGLNKSGQCDVSGWQDVVAVAAGSYASYGLRADGTVVAAGDAHQEVTTWRDIVAIDAGNITVVGIKSDGTVVSAGFTEEGKDRLSRWYNVVAISTDSLHTVALLSNGTVIAHGNNDYGQCDVYGWSDIVAISAGTLHTVGLRSDGTVVVTGNNMQNQCDIGG